MRRTRGPDDGSVEVELVEVGLDVDASDALADPARSGRGPDGMPGAPDGAPDGPRTERSAGRRRTLWWVGAGVIAALVVIVVSVNVVDARNEAARRQALAELPWVLPHLSGPLEEVWRAPGGYVMAGTASLLVMTDFTSGSMAAVDAASGDVVWERAPSDDFCRAFIDPSRWTGLTGSDAIPVADLLICLPNGVDQYAEAAEGAVASDAGLPDVELLEVTTGRVVASIPVEGDLIGSDFVGDDVVLTSVLADGSVQVVRTVARTGEPVWTYRSAPALVAADGFARAYVVEGVVLIQADHIVAVSTETGREAPVPDGVLVDGTVGEGATTEAVIPLPDGAQVRFRYEPTTGRAEAGRVVEADGSTRFTFDGEPWWQCRSDGSAAGVFVVQQDDTTGDPDYEGLLVGLDLATGRELWSVPDDFSQCLLQIDGLAMATGVKTSVIDVRTGRVLWEHPVSDEIASVALTDGDTVLLPRRGAGGEGLVAVDLRTGAESWWMPVTDGVYDVRVRDDGLVLLLTESEIVAYR